MPKKEEKSGGKTLVERIPTKIPGFDEVIGGGLVKNSLNLISGGPGCGKTIFCLQYIYNGVTQCNEKGLVISFDENLEAIRGDSRVFGWDFDILEKEKKCFFLLFHPFQNQNLKTDIENCIKRNNVKRVVIDSLSVFSMAVNDTEYRLRRELYRLASLLKSVDCTTIVTSEISGEAPLDVTSGGGSFSRDGLIEFVADSVTTLHNSGIGGEADRAIRVVKMRRTNHRRDPVPMRITDKGMVIG